MSRSLNPNPRMYRPPHSLLLAILKPLSTQWFRALRGATSPNLSYADTTQFAVPINHPFTITDDTPKDVTPTLEPAHTDRESPSCFAAAVYTQWTNMTARVFTQNKRPRPARGKPRSAGSKGQLAPDEQLTAYPPAAHFPVAIDIKHALNGMYARTWRNAICSELASLHIEGTFRMGSLPLRRNAIGIKWVFNVNAGLDGSANRFKGRLVAHGFSQCA
jgi:hypothetical protein